MNRNHRFETAPQHALALHWILRVAFAMDFIGHGTYGWLQKPVFAKYLSVVGIPPETGIHLLPFIGAHDYILALGVLFAPTRAFLLWGGIWGLWTALLRPMTGESWWEVLDRGGNYGMPFALFLLAGGVPATARGWFTRVREWRLPAATRDAFAWTLRLATGFCLIGHGAYGAVVHKEILTKHWAAIGLGPDLFGPGGFVPTIGWIEIALGLFVLAKPLPALLYGVAAFKIGTELLYPVSGQPPLVPVFEFIERGGSYACPLALGLLLHWERLQAKSVAAPAREAAPQRSPA
jgi:hypothetical protein